MGTLGGAPPAALAHLLAWARAPRAGSLLPLRGMSPPGELEGDPQGWLYVRHVPETDHDASTLVGKGAAAALALVDSTMSEKHTNASSGIGVTGLLGVMFVGLRLCEIIHWSWWWVTAPFWMPPVLFLIGFIVYASWMFWHEWRMSRRKASMHVVQKRDVA